MPTNAIERESTKWNTEKKEKAKIVSQKKMRSQEKMNMHEGMGCAKKIRQDIRYRLWYDRDFIQPIMW